VLIIKYITDISEELVASILRVVKKEAFLP
jgi:hypothetical protein